MTVTLCKKVPEVGHQNLWSSVRIYYWQCYTYRTLKFTHLKGLIFTSFTKVIEAGGGWNISRCSSSWGYNSNRQAYIISIERTDKPRASSPKWEFIKQKGKPKKKEPPPPSLPFSCRIKIVVVMLKQWVYHGVFQLVEVQLSTTQNLKH